MDSYNRIFIESVAKVDVKVMIQKIVILQRNMFYLLIHLLGFGLSKAQAISKITKESADIIGIHNLDQIRLGFKSSFVVWN